MESDFAASLTEEKTQEADTAAKYEKITQEIKSKIAMVPKTVQIIDYLDMKVQKKLDETTADLKRYAKFSDNATVAKDYAELMDKDSAIMLMKKSGKINGVTAMMNMMSKNLDEGKTALLNNILTATDGKKIAVIENEFGEGGIDDDLVKKNIKTQSDEEIVDMMNGCI